MSEPIERLVQIMPEFVRLTVGFLDNPSRALRSRIVQHMNAWGKTTNVKFVQTQTDPKVRIARAGGQDGGYWSYLGTDILSIPANEATMNLEGFTINTPESEFIRVVRHETGHTMGFPHEHMRRELVQKIDPAEAADLLWLRVVAAATVGSANPAGAATEFGRQNSSDPATLSGDGNSS